MYEVDLRRGFTRPCMILVWNGPRQMLSHTVTSSSMFTSRDPPQAPSSKVSAPSGPGMTVPNQQESSRATLIVDHDVARLSISLSDNVDQSADSTSPHNQGDPSSEIRFIGHHQEYHILFLPCNTRHLHMQDDKPERASMHPTQPHEVHCVVHEVFQREDGEPVLLHQSGCDHIHLTATVC